ncbi:MAG: PEP-CTERM sorting domain-containing protein [Phycisphaerae bacterium]|nr:PEP-CTERM sorting domain-containing protein [Phycisphaerae bacterium]
MSGRKIIALLVGIVLFCVAGAVSAYGATYTSDFAGSFEGWDWQWVEDYPPGGTDGIVSLSTVRGYNDGASLLFDMGDGRGDDGTLWIENSFPVQIGTPTDVGVSFQLYNVSQSDMNTFNVKTYIGQENPDQQWDFAYLGETDTEAGWVQFDYDQTVMSNTGEVWVAVGIRVAWETHRDYWIDHVEVDVVPEPMTLALMGLGGLMVLRRRRSA